MTDKKRAALQAALDAITELEGYSRSAVTDKIARDAKQQLRAALAEQPVKESLTTHSSIIDSIADHLIDDHVALMNENKRMRAAAQAALEAMEDHANQYPHMQKGYTVDAITDLRAALAEQEVEQEPVAWQYVWSPGMYYTTDSRGTIDNYVQGAEDRLPPGKRGYVRPLYTTPPRREWQSLTDEEIAEIHRTCKPAASPWPLSRAIEAALKEKNT